MFTVIALTFALFTGMGSQPSMGTKLPGSSCEHAAPPKGMHYVCDKADMCSCHLEPDGGDPADVKRGGSSFPDVPSCSAADVTYFVAPGYPVRARQAGTQGTVIALVQVGEAGTVNEVRLKSGDEVFAPEVVEALKKWRFAASAKAQTVNVTLNFALSGVADGGDGVAVSGTSPLNMVITANLAGR